MAGAIPSMQGDLGFKYDPSGLNKMADHLEAASKEARSLADGATSLETSTTRASRGVRGLQVAAGAATAVIGAGTAVIASSVQAARGYETAMAEVSTLLDGEAAASFDTIKDKVLETSAALGVDAVQGANAAYSAISAGVDATSVDQFLEVAGKAATAGVAGLDTSVSALTVGLNAYGLEVDESTRVSDAMFKAVKLGVTTFGELGGSIGKVAGIAASFRSETGETLIPIEDLSASIAQITTKGFATAEAVTAAKASMVALQKGSKPLTAAFDFLNERYDTNITSGGQLIEQFGGYQGALEALSEYVDDSGTSWAALFGTVEAANAALALTGPNADGARQKLDEVRNGAGATEEAYAKMAETTDVKLAQFREAFNSAKIQLGQAFLPIVAEVADAVTPLLQRLASAAQAVGPMVDRFREAPGPLKLVIAGLAGIAGAASIVISGAAGLAAVFGPAVSAMGGFAGVAGAASGAAGLLGAAISTLLGPVGLAIGAVAVLGVAVSKATQAQNDQFAALEGGGRGIASYVAAAQKARDESGFLAKVGFVLKEVWYELTEAFRQLMDFLAPAGEAIKGVGSAIGGLLEKAGIGFDLGGIEDVQALRESAAAYAQIELGVSQTTLELDAYKDKQFELQEAVQAGTLNVNVAAQELGRYALALENEGAAADEAAAREEAKARVIDEARDSYTSYSNVVLDSSGNIVAASEEELEARLNTAERLLGADQAEIDSITETLDIKKRRGQISQEEYDAELERLATLEGRTVSVGESVVATISEENAALLGLGDTSAQASRSVVADQSRMGDAARDMGANVDAGVASATGAVEGLSSGIASEADGVVSAYDGVSEAVRGGSKKIEAAASSSQPALDAQLDTIVTGADAAERAMAARVGAEEASASAAESGADQTITSLEDVMSVLGETSDQTADLTGAYEGVPTSVTTDIELRGVRQAQDAIQDVLADLDALKAGVSFKITGTYEGSGGAEKESPMAVLQDVHDLFSLTSRAFALRGKYYGTGLADAVGSGLALSDALDELYQRANDPLVIRGEFFWDERVQEFYSQLGHNVSEFAEIVNAEVDRLEIDFLSFLDSQNNALRRAADFAVQLTEAYVAFLRPQEGVDAEGSLPWVLEQLREIDETAALVGQSLSEGLRQYLNGGISIDFAGIFASLGIAATNLDEFGVMLAQLSAEPERQAELWDRFTAEFERSYQRQIDSVREGLENARAELQRTMQDTSTPGAEEQEELERIERALEQIGLLEQAIANARDDQEHDLGLMLEAYQTLVEEAEHWADQAEAVRREQEALLKQVEQVIKAQQKQLEDAERAAHDLTMELLEDELEAIEEQYDRQSKLLDLEIAELEKKREAQLEAHEARMEQLDEEAQALKDIFDDQKRVIDEAKIALERLELGAELSAEQTALLKSLGIDPKVVLEAEKAAARQESILEKLKELLGDLPTGLARERLEDVTGAAEIAALQAALDQGLIDPSDQRIVEVALAGWAVRAERLREILESVTDEMEDAKEEAEEGPATGFEAAKLIIDLLENEQKTRKLLLDDELEGIEARKQALQEEYDQRDAGFLLRISQIEAEKAATKERFDFEKQAIQDARDAEKERHDSRMAQIQAEYALELLRLGKTEEEVQAILAEQQRRAATIAAEASARWFELQQEIEDGLEAQREEQRRLEEEARRRTELTPTIPEPSPVPIEPIVLPPGGGGGGGRRPPGTTSIDDFFQETSSEAATAFSSMADSAAEAGGAISGELLDPNLQRMGALIASSLELRDVLRDIAGLGGGLVGDSLRTGAGLFVFNGDVVLDREFAEEYGILDALGRAP